MKNTNRYILMTILISILGRILCLPCYAQKVDKPALVIQNGYLDLRYLYKAWYELSKEQINLLKNQKSRYYPDKGKYWKELLLLETKLNTKLSNFHDDLQRIAKPSRLQRRDFKKSKRLYEKIIFRYPSRTKNFEKLSRYSVKSLISKINKRIADILRNQEILKSYFRNGLDSFSPASRKLLIQRFELLNKKHLLLNGRFSSYSEEETRTFMEHLESYYGYELFFIINCMRQKIYFNQCFNNFNKFKNYLNANVFGKLLRDEILAFQIREYRSSIDLTDGLGNSQNYYSGNRQGGLRESEDINNLNEISTITPGRNGDLFFLSTDSLCGGQKTKASLGYIYEPSAKNKFVDKNLIIGNEIIPLFNCIKGRNIISTTRPSTQCPPKREHIIGYVPTNKYFSSKARNRKHNTILSYSNPSSSQKIYASLLSSSAPKIEIKNQIKFIYDMGFTKEEGPIFLTFKDKKEWMKEIFRCKIIK